MDRLDNETIQDEDIPTWVKPPRRKWFALATFPNFILIATVTTFLVVLIGYLVRFNPQGLACPDWPTCYGQWNIPESYAARLEMAHRVLAGLSAGLILVAAAWARRRVQTSQIVRVGLALAAVSIAGQVVIGNALVSPLPGHWAGSVHLGLALITLGLMAASTTAAYLNIEFHAGWMKAALRSPFTRLALVTSGLIFMLMVSGLFVTDLNAGATCTGWPFCAGGIPEDGYGWLAFGHRVWSLLAGTAVIMLFIRAWRVQYQHSLPLASATTVGILFIGQVGVGALKVVRDFPSDLTMLHALLTAGLWAALIVLSAAVVLVPTTAFEERSVAALIRPQGTARLKAFVALNKPIIVILLLVTTYAGMVVGGRQLPSPSLTFWTILGGALAAGGASALNQYIDRTIDGSMQRTAKRPLPAGLLTPAEGLAYGIGACLAAFFIMAGMVNILSAVLSFAGMIYYVLLYSILLKYSTSQNIVIGGGAGAIPPLVGWAAATGSLNIPSMFLFALVFMWTPPHFWALALVRRKDYARAGVPMLPVVKGEQETRLQIFIYTLELVALTLLMPVFKVGGSVFLVSAVVLGLWIIYAAWKVLKKPGNKVAWQMYRYSSMYLAFIFLALVIDVLV